MAATEISPARETGPGREPVDAVVERLNDPTVAASVVTLLDNAELLSTLVLGLSGLIERGDTIADSLAAGVAELSEGARASGEELALPKPAEVATTPWRSCRC